LIAHEGRDQTDDEQSRYRDPSDASLHVTATA
jgi:hypothetical protein